MQMNQGGKIGRGILVAVAALALTMACTQEPESRAKATDPQRQDGQSALGTRTVTGTIKSVVADGFVVIGREQGGSEREWAFAIDSGTRIDRDGAVAANGSLHEGDSVTVNYTNSDGKIVARSVTSAVTETSGSR